MSRATRLLACVRALFQRGEWPKIDQELAQALDAHGLAPHVYAHLQRQGIAAPLLRKAWLTAAALQRAPALQKALSALAGIPVIGWKGIDYARHLYPDASERPMGDHDLLVPLADFAEAKRRLHAEGYHDALVQEGVARHPAHYAAQLCKGDHQLDLHHAVRQRVRATIDYDAVFARAAFSAGLGRLEAADRVLFHLAHMAGHELMVPLIAFVDLEYLLAETPVSPALLARARSYGISRPLAAVQDARAELFAWPHKKRLRPSLVAIAARRRPARALQLLRKAALFDSPAALWRFLRFSTEALRQR